MSYFESLNPCYNYTVDVLPALSAQAQPGAAYMLSFHYEATVDRWMAGCNTPEFRLLTTEQARMILNECVQRGLTIGCVSPYSSVVIQQPATLPTLLPLPTPPQ